MSRMLCRNGNILASHPIPPTKDAVRKWGPGILRPKNREPFRPLARLTPLCGVPDTARESWGRNNYRYRLVCSRGWKIRPPHLKIQSATSSAITVGFGLISLLAGMPVLYSVLYLLYLLYHQIVDQSSSFEIQPRAPRLILADPTSELPCPCYIDASPITASIVRTRNNKSLSKLNRNLSGIWSARALYPMDA